MRLVPGLASTHFLVQRVGFGRASETCLSGRLYGGAEAHAWGLADRLRTPDDLLPQALAPAGEMAANPGPQLRTIKALLGRNGCDSDLGAVQRRETDMLIECWKSPEHRDAVRAFLSSRDRAR